MTKTEEIVKIVRWEQGLTATEIAHTLGENLGHSGRNSYGYGTVSGLCNRLVARGTLYKESEHRSTHGPWTVGPGTAWRYYTPEYAEARDIGLLDPIQPIHKPFSIEGSTSGRFSCKEPNITEHDKPQGHVQPERDPNRTLSIFTEILENVRDKEYTITGFSLEEVEQGRTSTP